MTDPQTPLGAGDKAAKKKAESRRGRGVADGAKKMRDAKAKNQPAKSQKTSQAEANQAQEQASVDFVSKLAEIAQEQAEQPGSAQESHELAREEREGDDHVEQQSTPQEENADEITQLKEQISSLKDRILRVMADAENLRRREEREKQDIRQYAAANFARDLLSMADNLRRAIEAAPDEIPAAMQLVMDGIGAIEREFFAILRKYGVRKIEPAGETFDPNQHEAMFQAPSEEYPPGIVSNVIQPGYMMGVRLLRPAKVGVACEKQPESESGAQTASGSENLEDKKN